MQKSPFVKNSKLDAANISLESIRDWFLERPDFLSKTLNLNKSYSFFAISNEKPKGASNTELVAGHSIAVAPSYIPFGTILLAKVPILNEEGHLSRHEFRILAAQDRGGAINGPGHVDIYQGVGKDAERRASAMHHYGALWLILPAQ